MWKQCNNPYTRYEVNINVEVGNMLTKSIKKQRINNQGYKTVSLLIDKENIDDKYKISMVRVHRIVIFAFLGDPPTDNHTVDHIDQNKQNNNLSNLRWANYYEQAKNRQRIKTSSKKGNSSLAILQYDLNEN